MFTLKKFIWMKKMKKNILPILCLFIISMGLTCVAASDNSPMTAEPIQNTNQQHILVENSMTVENDSKDTSASLIKTDLGYKYPNKNFTAT